MKKISKVSVISIMILACILCIISVSAADINITNCTSGTNFDDVSNVINNNVSSGDTLFLGNQTFTSNGNVINIENKNLTVYGGSSQNDGKTSTFDGKGVSGIFNIKNSNILFIGLHFVNSGFTSVLPSDNLNTQNFIFNSNIKINSNGGAIFNINGTVNIVNSTFSNNLGTYGGAIYNNHELNISDSIFNNNTGQIGGAIYNANNLGFSHSVILNSTFIYNIANVGGAIYNNDGMDINNSKFIDNIANSADGGAIKNNRTLIISNSIFNNNSAVTGGTISNVGLLGIERSLFNNNLANLYGGAIYNEWSVYDISDCIFNNNKVKEGNGGAIANGGAMDITRSTFNGNYAKYYGGAISNINDIVIVNSIFNNNNAGYSGGAINAGSAYIINSTFNGNVAGNGAAIYGSGYYLVVINSTFKNNLANNGGGAIYLDGGSLSLLNNIFVNNTAKNKGGMIYLSNDYSSSSTDLINNTMTDGHASLGKYIYSGANADTLNLVYGSNNTIIVKYGNLIKLNATLTDDNGNPITDERNNLKFVVNGKEYNASVIEGVAYINITDKLEPGDYGISGYYYGSDKLNIFNGILKIVKLVTTIDADVILGSGGKSTIIIKVSDENGNILNTGTVIINILNKSYTLNIQSGVAKIDIVLPDIGIYNYYFKYNGDEHYLGCNGVGLIYLMYFNTHVTADVITGYPDDKSTINVKVVDERGKLVNNGTVTVNISGKTYSAKVVNGFAKFNVTLPDAGDYTYSIKYNASSYYGDSNGTGVIKVSKFNTHVTVDVVTGYPGGESVVNVKVVDERGKLVSDGNVTMNIFGKSYSAKVVNGFAKFNVTLPNAGTYLSSIKYNGANNYNPSNRTGVIKVSKFNTTVTVDVVTGHPGDKSTVNVKVVDERGKLVTNGAVS